MSCWAAAQPRHFPPALSTHNQPAPNSTCLCMYHHVVLHRPVMQQPRSAAAAAALHNWPFAPKTNQHTQWHVPPSVPSCHAALPDGA
eukprot:scaffold1915_cov22-Tisochrysis_lutea.AAC.4